MKTSLTDDGTFVIDLELEEKPLLNEAAKLGLEGLEHLTFMQRRKVLKVNIIQKEGVSIQTINTDIGWNKVHSLLESQQGWDC